MGGRVLQQGEHYLMANCRAIGSIATCTAMPVPVLDQLLSTTVHWQPQPQPKYKEKWTKEYSEVPFPASAYLDTSVSDAKHT